MSAIHRHLLCGAVALLAASAVPAQDSAKTATLGTARPGAKLLTYNELELCLKQRDDLGRRRPQLDAERTKLEGERKELLQIDESLQAERAKMDKLQETAADITRRSKELEQQVVEFNERVAKFDAAPPSGPTGDRQRRNLERDRATLDKARSELEAERAALGPNAEQLVKTYQARVEQRNLAADDMNKRNAALGKTFDAYESERAAWQADCEGRPYREDDEKAIRAGK